MPLNFNVTPFNDDYDQTDHFYRILFRPTVAVQARELTQLQTMLQQQVTFFGDSIYQHGSMVTPGQIATDPNTAYVQLLPTYGFVGPTPIPINLALFTNQIIVGSITGLQAQVVYSTVAVNADPPTLFVKYLNTGTAGQKTFVSSELLSIQGSIIPLAQTVASSPCGLGISAQIGEGVYYIYGIFVRVEAQYLILSKYTNIVSTSVGLEINESIITPQQDPALNDNAQGSSNYAAPGAYRYEIDLILTQQSLTSPANIAYVELLRLINSVTQQAVVADTYSVIETELAQRMSDTNGDFVVRNFGIDVRECLDTSFVTSGTAVGGTAATDSVAATISLANNASATTGAYNGMSLYISNGTGAGQTLFISAYNGSTKIATLETGYNSNQVADNTSVYTISDLTQVNRGIYPPPPFGIGDITQLAVGMESGRGYVDGYLVNTLNTTYVTMDKSRDSAQATGAVIPTAVGNYILVANLFNLPLTAASVSEDFLQISICNMQATGSFDQSQNEIGTARVHAFEFYQGVSAADSSAVFQMFLFDIKMNAGQNINNARSFYLTSNSDNNDGNSLNSWGDICAELSIGNVNGTGLIAGNIITGPSGVGTEVIISYDAINNLLLTQPNDTNGNQILTLGTITAPGTTSASLLSRTQIFDTPDSLLVYHLPENMVKTIRSADNTSNTSYFVREMFQAQRNGSGQFIFSTAPTTPFNSFSTLDFLACVVASSNSEDIGKYLDLTQSINSGSFSGSPANTTLTFEILEGLGSTPGCTIKLMGTVIKSAVSEKLKALTVASITYPNPTAVMSLQKADVYAITAIIDSGSPSIAPDPTNPAMLNIASQYTFTTGQTDYYYDVGSVSLATGAPGPVGQVLIQFTYFAHSGTGDYFSVDSYTNQVPYTNIPTYLASNGAYYPLRDCLDFRPRIADIGDNFADTGSSYSAPVKPNTIVQADFQYYLSVINKLYIDQYGNFQTITGTSALAPLPPPDPIDGMMLYTIQLNPYTLSTTDLTTTTTNNQRFTMNQIGLLEERIANLEYLVALNQLEQSTQSMQITDTATGLDRYKNGFITDNFSGMNIGNVFDGDFNCSVDPVEGSLRPPFVENNNSLLFAVDPSSGYVQRGTLLMLPYTSATLIVQPYATGFINVNPFAVFTWYGTITLDPATDTWIDTVQSPIITVTDDAALDGVTYLNQWSGVTWGSWQTQWVGTPVSTSTTTAPTTALWTSEFIPSDGTIVSVTNPGYNTGVYYTPNTTVPSTTVTTNQQIGQIQTGTQTATVAQTTQQINNSIVDETVVPYIRSRRIRVIGRNFQPNARVYPFFANTDVSAWCRPYCDPSIAPTLTQSTWTSQTVTWGGDFSPEADGDVGVSTIGSTGESGTYLLGNLNDPLLVDANGTTTIFFEIPCDATDKFATGSQDFRLTDSPTNGTDGDTYGDAYYTAAGILDQNQETITSISVPVTVTQTVSQTQTINNSTSVSTQGIVPITVWLDPLAQSILINSVGGCYVSKIDLFFQSADPSTPITLSIRNMVNGYPGQDIVPYSSKTLYPNNPQLSALTAAGTVPTNAQSLTSAVINVSANASVATTFEFDTPVYLNDGTEYAIVLISNSINYNVYTATLGGSVIGSTAVVSTTPYLGNLFKSQNASTWVADPTTNMMFTIWSAVFDPTQTGTVYFTNSSVQPAILAPLPFQTVSGSNMIRVLHPFHGMPKGLFVNSVVSFSNIAPGTYNGITDVQLTNTFSIANVDLYSYTIEVSGSAATGTGRVGPDGVIATQNQQYDSICPVISQLTPTGSSVAWNVEAISGKSPDNNPLAIQEPYQKDTAFSSLAVNTTTMLLAPGMIASDINETTSVIGATAFDRKSLVLQAVLSTTSANLSPLIDATRASVILINSLLDDPTFANRTIEAMDAGVVITSTSENPLTFASQTILSVIAVTGGQYTVSETVLGAVSGAQGIVVAWDSLNLTLNAVSGTFQVTEAVSGGSAIGTVANIQTVNTITNPTSVLDFSVFQPGYSITIAGCPSNQYLFANPVVILSVVGNQITVDTGVSGPFVAASDQSNVQLTQYNRFVAESGPDGCTTSARYLTRQFTLQSVANSLQVYFDINLPPGAFVDCYYRIQSANSTANFNSIIWVPMVLNASATNGVTTNYNSFTEFVYEADDIGPFTSFAVKIVMRGGNSSQIPREEQLRGIALAT